MNDSNDTDRAQIDALFTRVYDAWARHDADAFAALYTEDATVVRPQVLHLGRQAVRDSMAAGFAGRLQGTRGTDTPLDVRVAGDTAVVVSRGGILMPGEDVVPAEREVNATWVLVREADEWRVAAYANAPR